MIPSILLEPSPLNKRQSYGKVLTGLARPEFESIDNIKQRLGELRSSVLAELDSLVDELNAILISG
ncbi:hypothetical protein ACFLTS_07085 [Chloroflexota bacterium]